MMIVLLNNFDTSINNDTGRQSLSGLCCLILMSELFIRYGIKLGVFQHKHLNNTGQEDDGD